MAPGVNCKALQNDGGWWEDLLANRCSFPIGPINTFTNLAYIAGGLITWFHFRTAASWVFGLTMVLLGIASGYYHGFKNKLSGHLDDAGMYAVFTALTVYSLGPHANYIAWLMAALSVVVVWQVGFGTHEDDWLRVFMGVFVATVVLRLLFMGAWVFGLVGLGLMGLAYQFWQMDQRKTFWLPRWGHGFWHLLTALGITLFFWGVR